MSKLWNKESNGLYVDIFHGYNPNWLNSEHQAINVHIQLYKITWQKDDTVAIEKRNMGNLFFAKKIFLKAMQCYNESLCFAENGSEHIAFAYGNRSSCFFHFQMYEKCIIDIDLAIKANYPPEKMAKLEKRRADCQKFIANGKSVEGEKPTLSFEPNHQCPALAKTVKLNIDPIIGYQAFATQDLNVGQTIYMEKCYVGESFINKYSNCNICYESRENFVPCKNCTIAMFCHGKCQSNELHNIECDVKKFPFSSANGLEEYSVSLIRLISLAIRNFSNIDQLINFVEHTVNSKELKMPNFANEKSKYQMFLEMKNDKFTENIIPSLYSIFKIMINQKQIAETFHTEKYRRFLMHLTLKHYLVLAKYFFAYTKTNPIQSCDQYHAEMPEAIYVAHLTILISIFQHSCAPNTVLAINNGSTIGVVLRPIKKGEQLNVCRFTNLPESYVERKKLLWERCEVCCDCERCKLKTEKIFQNHLLQNDPDFRFICSSAEEKKTLKEKCVTFLTKYGRLPWSMEIEICIRKYAPLLFTERDD